MNYGVFGVFVIFLVLMMPLPVFAQNTQVCGDGTIPDTSTGQCIPQCGEGTFLNGTMGCVIEPEPIDWGQIEYIAVGIITGVGATVFGIIWTIIARRAERKKEDLELIQNYGTQISEIIQEEENLETKLDCSLYAERYLDTLDQMASLLYKRLIRGEVTDYFENQFKYGMNLWYWYKENIEKFPKQVLKNEFEFGLEDLEKSKKKKAKKTDDRWYYFRWWCCAEGIIFNNIFMKTINRGRNEKEKYEPFKPKTRADLAYSRLSLLKTTSDAPQEHSDILEDLILLFRGYYKTDEKNTDEKNIYDIVKKHTANLKPDSDLAKRLSPFVFIKRYAESDQYGILPETMESDFEDIPDENGMSKFEVVETIQRFGEILNNISSKEKDLNSKLDCSLYVEQYLDILEQIATLYHKRVIPKKAADYFENKFSYGINLLNWYNKYVNKNPSEFNPYSEEFSDEEKGKEERWREFKWFCRGGDTRKIKITKFQEEEERRILPDVMYDYEFLPNEEGLKPSEVIEIMRNYSKQLTEISGKETELETKIDCSVYAEQYLDTLEQIAYLFNEKSLATDAVTYFENNFTYGLTLKNWYTDAVSGADEQEDRWTEFNKYCKNFVNAKGEKGIKAFEIGNTLPSTMLYYNTLPADKVNNKYEKPFDYELK